MGRAASRSGKPLRTFIVTQDQIVIDAIKMLVEILDSNDLAIFEPDEQRVVTLFKSRDGIGAQIQPDNAGMVQSDGFN
ncbi:hypothetical protein SAMN05518849_109170 [Sphingobium sp. AP50]|nr:hypothetical protein [Sphingobium sp. AP50]SEJ60900.1 hypothetical protein SAMN05518849_109170 [Sphingobium sp. AP50]